MYKTTIIVIMILCIFAIALGLITYISSVPTPEEAQMLNEKKRHKGRSIEPRASDCDISRLDCFINGKVPIEYEEFLRLWNGFQFDSDCRANSFYKYNPDYDSEEDIGADVIELFPVGTEDHRFYGVIGRQGGSNFNLWVDPNLLAIGRGWSGAIICIAVRGDDNGFIYHFDCNSREDGSRERSRKGVRLVAKSFWEFWNSIETLDH